MAGATPSLQGHDDGRLTGATVGAGQAVVAAAPGAAVAQAAFSAVIEKQSKRHRRRRRLHRRERIGVGHAMKLLVPGVIATQQGSRCGRPTHVGASCGRRATVNAGVDRCWRRVAKEHVSDIAR